MIELALEASMRVMTQQHHKELRESVKPLWDKVYEENFKLQRSIGELAAFVGYATVQLGLLLEHSHTGGNSGNNEQVPN